MLLDDVVAADLQVGAMEVGANMPVVGLDRLKGFFAEGALNRIKLLDVSGKETPIDFAGTTGEGPPDMLHGRSPGSKRTRTPRALVRLHKCSKMHAVMCAAQAS